MATMTARPVPCGALAIAGVLALVPVAGCSSASGPQQTASPTPGGTASIVGTWNCGPPPRPEEDDIEIRADGTVTNTDPESDRLSGELTWTVEGDRVSFNGDSATIDSEDRLVFDDGFSCTRADGGGGGTSAEGRYECGIEGQPTREAWELLADGELRVTVFESGEAFEGTWSVEDDRVIINHAGAANDPFTVEENRLVFGGPAGPEGAWVCTRAG